MNTRNTWLGDVMFAVVGYGTVMALFAFGVMYTTQRNLERAFNQPFESQYAVEDVDESPLPYPSGPESPVSANPAPPLALAGATN